MILGGLSGIAGAPAQAETLRWKFKPGEALHWVMDQKTVVRETAGDRESKITNTQSMNVTWTVKSVGNDGRAELTLTIDRLRAKVETPVGAIEYDSQSTKAPTNPLTAGAMEILKAMIGAEFSLKMAPTGELSDVRVPEKVTKALRESSQGAPGGGNVFSVDGLKNMINEMGLTLPADNLTQGKSWTRESKVKTPVGGVDINKTFRFEGADQKAGPNVFRIAMSAKVAHEPLPEKSEFQISFKTHSQDGTILFDQAAGRITRSSVTENVESTIKVMGMEVKSTNNTTTTMTLAPGGDAAK
jgi:hypothetical protein